jgi:N6-adenosine-specific RNA methylase IME4
VRAFRVHVSDPPWRFGDPLPGSTRGAARQYPCMPTTEIMRFPLPPMLDDSVLFMWRVAAMQQDALDVGRTWGFTLKSEIVWQKLTKRGLPWFGMGRYARASHETCLIFTRGRFKVRDRGVRSTFSAPVPVADGKYVHSAKPDAFYELVERMCEGPYVETFSRRRRDGWTHLGNQVPAALAA